MRLAVVAVVVGVVTPVWAAPPVLERIEVLADNASAVRLRLSAPVPASAHPLAAEGSAPHRVYLDLAGVVLGPGVQPVVDGAGPLLLRVRTAQFDHSTVRVVLDLAEAVPFAIHDSDLTLTVELKPQAPAPSPSPPPPPPPPAPPPPPRPPPPPPPSSSAPPPTAPTPPAAAPTPAPPPRPDPASRSALGANGPLLIVLDAGHGGRDPGAAGVDGVVEKDVVLEVTRLLARRLRARPPLLVLMTRTDDSFVPLERRLSAAGAGAALFLSLHANACSDASARGLEVFYGGGDIRTAATGAASQRAALLGRTLDEALRKNGVGPIRAARPGDFRVLVRNPVPSALVEIGYLTHPGDAAQARNAQYQALLADALAEGVTAFLAAATPPL